MEDARDGKRVVSQDTMESTQSAPATRSTTLLPDEWKQDDAQSDFDLIKLTLDRMEAAVGAGEYAQAEQSRLEAYAFFEFGPELSLRSIAPDVTAKVEGLIWFGAEGKEGLANLIARKKPRREVHETRLALDDALPGRRRLARRGRDRGDGGDQRRRDRLPRGPRGGADPRRRDGAA